MGKSSRLVATANLLGGATASLVFGAAHLHYRLPGGLPLGNLLAATGIVALAYLPVLLSTPATAARDLSRFVLVVAVAWLPVSALAAGNLALNFTGSAGTLWIAGTVLLVLLAVIALVWALAQQACTVIRRRRPQLPPNNSSKPTPLRGAA